MYEMLTSARPLGSEKMTCWSIFFLHSYNSSRYTPGHLYGKVVWTPLYFIHKVVYWHRHAETRQFADTRKGRLLRLIMQRGVARLLAPTRGKGPSAASRFQDLWCKSVAPAEQR